MLKRNASQLTVALAVFDTACVLGAGLIAAYLTHHTDGSQTLRDHFIEHRFYYLSFMVVWLLAAGDQQLFASQRIDSLPAQLFGIGKAMVIALCVTATLTFFVSRQGIDRTFFAYFAVSVAVTLVAFRLTLRLSLWAIRRRGYNFRQILVIGGNPRAKHLADVATTHGRYGFQFVGLLDDEPERADYLKEYGVPYLGPLSDLEQVLLSRVVDEVYICLPVRKYYESIQSAAHLCEGVGAPVRFIADLFPLRVATSRVHQLEDIPVLSLSAIPEAFTQLMLKRAIDMAVAFVFLATVAWWLFPILAMLIKLDSPGPVFFIQERVGLNGRRFGMIKFRTMVPNAEALKATLAAQNEADGPVFKMKRDPRMTRVGRWLRKFSIDEIPQIINVFIGDMSLVGPRPPVPAEVAKYTWDQRRRLSVRPGITGLQQVSGRSDLVFKDWVEIDLAYIDNWSLMEDFRILFRTFQVVVLAKGAA